MQRLHLRLGRARDHRPGLGRGGKQRGGLAANDLQIDRLIGRQILRGGQLQNLALGNRGRGVGQDAEYPQISGFDHQLKAAGKKVITHQNRRFIVPQQIGRRPPAPLGAFIDDVVMQQGRGMDKLDRGGQMDMEGAGIAAQIGRRQRQHRAQALAARLDQMRGHFGDARGMLRCHPRPDELRNLPHLARQKFCQTVLRHCSDLVQSHPQFLAHPRPLDS